jgi:hypothetical protein
MDDLGFHSNQCDCNLFDDYVYVQAMLFGMSNRVSDNRFKEGVFNALYSAMTIGLFNATTNNQSTHCILVLGMIASLKVENGNKALVDVYGDCDGRKASLSSAASGLGMLGALMGVPQ